MNINSVLQNSHSSYAGGGIVSKLYNLIPNFKPLYTDPEKYNRYGTAINRPDINRAIMGGTAIISQPVIDYCNPNVDKETASVAACRTVGKIMACTTVGVGVRYACCKLIDACTSRNPNAPAWQRLLMPTREAEMSIKKKNVNWFKNYKNTLATTIGLGVMLFTNVLLDVPLTNWITSKLLNYKNSLEKDSAKHNSNQRKGVL